MIVIYTYFKPLSARNNIVASRQQQKRPCCKQRPFAKWRSYLIFITEKCYSLQIYSFSLKWILLNKDWVDLQAININWTLSKIRTHSSTNGYWSIHRLELFISRYKDGAGATEKDKCSKKTDNRSFWRLLSSGVVNLEWRERNRDRNDHSLIDRSIDSSSSQPFVTAFVRTCS